MTPGLIVCAAALAVAASAGVAWRRGGGRMRDPRPAGGRVPLPRRFAALGRGTVAAVGPSRSVAVAALAAAPVATEADLGQPLGSRATLLQFSSAFCAPCRATRRILAEVAGMTDGVAHVEIDAESRLDLVRRLDVRRTPAVFVLGPDGEVRKQATGQPRKADVIAALGGFL